MIGGSQQAGLTTALNSLHNNTKNYNLIYIMNLEDEE